MELMDIGQSVSHGAPDEPFAAHTAAENDGRATSSSISPMAPIWKSFFIPCPESSHERLMKPVIQITCSEFTSNGFEIPKRSLAGYFAVSAATGTSISSLRITRLVAFSVASSKPWPWVMASVGQASTQ